MGMFEYVKIKEAIGKVQDAVGKIYDDIKAIPKTSGAMKAGAFREEAISLGRVTTDITNCVFSITGKGKLHAAWLAPIELTQGSGSTSYRWGLKVVIDDEVVFDVQKKPETEDYYEGLGSVGFITASIYSSGIENIYSSTNVASSELYRGTKLIPFKEPSGYNMGRKNFAPFILHGFGSAGYAELNDNSGEFSDGVGNGNSGTSAVVLPKVPVTSHYLASASASASSSRFISATSIIPEPIIFDKSVKVYASYKHNSGPYLTARIAYTLE